MSLAFLQLYDADCLAANNQPPFLKPPLHLLGTRYRMQGRGSKSSSYFRDSSSASDAEATH